jgi:hypothetical protein
MSSVAPRPHIERSNVSGWGRMRFRVRPAQDDQVFVDGAGRSQRYGLQPVVTAQSLAQVNSSILAKRGDSLAVGRVDRIQVISDARQNAAVMAICPVRNGPSLRSTWDPRIEFP